MEYMPPLMHFHDYFLANSKSHKKSWLQTGGKLLQVNETGKPIVSLKNMHPVFTASLSIGGNPKL